MVEYRNRRSLTVVSDPVNTESNAFAVALAEMKSFLKVDDTTEDALILEYMGASVQMIEAFCHRAIITKTYDFQLDRPNYAEPEPLGGLHNVISAAELGFGQFIDLPMPPLVTISSIKTYDTANAVSTLSSTYYTADLAGGRVYLNQGYSWPTALRDRASMIIRYTAGYGATYDQLPVLLRLAIKQHVGVMYDSRELADIPDAVKKNNLAPYRLFDGLAFA